MAHKDIYTKYMIEYDKANVTSSYPSLTEFEVATVLDKAYNALIAQKVTGNNIRKSVFESDIKSVADLGPLTKSVDVLVNEALNIASNALKAEMPEDLLYFLQGSLWYNGADEKHTKYSKDTFNTGFNPADAQFRRKLPVKLVNHEIATKFMASAYNIPWIKEPVCYIEDKDIIVIYDPLNKPLYDETFRSLPFYTNGMTGVGIFKGTIDDLGVSLDNIAFEISEDNSTYVIQLINSELDGPGVGTYIKYNHTTNTFNDGVIINDEEALLNIIKQNLQKYSDATFVIDAENKQSYDSFSDPNFGDFVLVPQHESISITYIRRPNTFVKDLPTVTTGYVGYFDYSPDKANEQFGDGKTYKERYEFECNSTMAEELISLAIAFALENVESQRLNSKLNMRGLEA